MDQLFSVVLWISAIIILISYTLMTIITFSRHGIECIFYCLLIYSFIILYKLNVHVYTGMRNKLLTPFGSIRNMNSLVSIGVTKTRNVCYCIDVEWSIIHIGKTTAPLRYQTFFKFRLLWSIRKIFRILMYYWYLFFMFIPIIL